MLVLGIAYKRDIDDMRESPSLDVMALLHQKGARVRYADPYVPTLAARAWPGGFDLQTEPLTAAAIADADCVAILTEHRSVDYDMVLHSAKLIVDTRNAIAGKHAHVFKLGAPASGSMILDGARAAREGAGVTTHDSALLVIGGRRGVCLRRLSAAAQGVGEAAAEAIADCGMRIAD